MIYSNGMPVHKSMVLKSGELYEVRDGIFHYLLIGARPWTPVESAGYDAKRIVNHGLRDVLEWLGEKPIPARHPTYNSVWIQLIADSEVTIPTEDFFG